MYLLQGDYPNVKDYCEELFADDYFEFELSYVSENEKFKEIDRFLWESRHECTRYKNRYNGNFAIGITEWNDKTPNKYFDAFMFFLKDYMSSARSCVIFVEDYIDKSLLNALKKHFNLTIKELSLTEKDDFTMKKIGFCIDFDNKENENVRI